MPRVFVPPVVRPLVGGAEFVDVAGGTVGAALEALDALHPGVRDRLRRGDVPAPGLTIAVDGSIAPLGFLTRVAPGAEIHFLPAIGGG